MADLRGDLRRWIAGVGAVASVVLAGLGWTQADRLFPLAPTWWLAPVAVACTVAAVGGSVFLFMRLYTAQNRILVGSDLPLPRDTGIRKAERRKITKFLDEQARGERAIHLRDLDARAGRLDRIAVSLALEGDPLATDARKESDRLNTYVGVSLGRVGVFLLESRARDAMSGIKTWVALSAAAFGIAGLFAVSNYSQGQRVPAEKAVTCLQRVAADKKLSTTLRSSLNDACVKLVAP